MWLSKSNPCLFPFYGEVGKSQVGWATATVTFLLVGWALDSFLTQKLQNLLIE